MSTDNRQQADQQRPEFRSGERPTPLLPLEPEMTAPQAALARAQATQARFDLGLPVLKPGPENGIQSAPTPTVSTDQPSLMVQIVGLLERHEYLTSIFLADGPTTGDQMNYWGPSLDVAISMAIDLSAGIGPRVRRYQLFRGPQDLPDKTTHQKTAAAIQSCLGMLRSRGDVNFALVWYIEGEDQPHIALVGFTFESALSQIGKFLAGDVLNHLTL
jgi:hypothetical protein